MTLKGSTIGCPSNIFKFLNGGILLERYLKFCSFILLPIQKINHVESHMFNFMTNNPKKIT